ncbi:MAG: folylpolyglutamate synthase/dihydrofolate synthase family protein [Alphaproteobacteria bacterium]
MKIDDYLQRFTQLHPKSIDLSLDRIRRLLDRLGNPQKGLPPVVHVAGTNGKGSVVAYLRAILAQAGRRAHCYTSPHLVRFNERIRLPSGLIADDMLEGLFDECVAANGDEPITFFEITTVAALLAFSREPADYVLLEVGLGGRLDTTNVSETTQLSVITPISYDHQRFLGETLAEIAHEKAGILRAGVPTLVAPQPDEAEAAIIHAARKIGAPLVLHGRDWRYDVGPPPTAIYDDFAVDLRSIALPGVHQQTNAAVAAVAARLLDDDAIDRTAIQRGLKAAAWPARLQRLGPGPLRDLLPEEAELWLDGGHNAAAATVQAQWLASHGHDGHAPHVIIGMMQTKDPTRFLANLRAGAATAWCVPIPGEEKAIPASELATLAHQAGFTAHRADSVADALRQIGRIESQARVLICGSLYLAGTVLRANGEAVT